MAYYNLFKIVRQIFKDILGNKTYRKILIILVAFILFLLIKPNFSKATIDFVDNGNNVSLPDPPSSYDGVTTNYYYIYKPQYNPSNYYYLLISSEVVTATSNSFRTQHGSKYGYMYTFTFLVGNDVNWRSNAPVRNGDVYVRQWLFASTDLYNTNGDLIISPYKNPELMNSISSLETLNFNNFIIKANSFTGDMIENPDEPLVMLFYNRSLGDNTNTDSLYPIKEKYFYKESIYFDKDNSTDTNYVFSYPIFKSGVFFNIGSTYEIKLAKRVYIEEYNTWGYDYFDNSYVFTVSSNVTQDYINQLNQQTATTTDEDNQKQINNALNEQTNAINNQTESIDNINNSINNSNVDNSSIDLPTDNTNNPTQSGIDNIFQTIYNGFTSGTPQDIVFPLPYSTNNITIKPNYINQMLNSSERRKNSLFSYSSFLLVRYK